MSGYEGAFKAPYAEGARVRIEAPAPEPVAAIETTAYTIYDWMESKEGLGLTSPLAAKVYAMIYQRSCRSTGYFVISQDALAEAARCSRQTVWRTVRDLVKKGLVLTQPTTLLYPDGRELNGPHAYYTAQGPINRAFARLVASRSLEPADWAGEGIPADDPDWRPSPEGAGGLEGIAVESVAPTTPKPARAARRAAPARAAKGAGQGGPSEADETAEEPGPDAEEPAPEGPGEVTPDVPEPAAAEPSYQQSPVRTAVPSCYSSEASYQQAADGAAVPKCYSMVDNPSGEGVGEELSTGMLYQNVTSAVPGCYSTESCGNAESNTCSKQASTCGFFGGTAGRENHRSAYKDSFNNEEDAGVLKDSTVINPDNLSGVNGVPADEGAPAPSSSMPLPSRLTPEQSLALRELLRTWPKRTDDAGAREASSRFCSLLAAGVSAAAVLAAADAYIAWFYDTHPREPGQLRYMRFPATWLAADDGFAYWDRVVRAGKGAGGGRPGTGRPRRDAGQPPQEAPTARAGEVRRMGGTWAYYDQFGSLSPLGLHTESMTRAEAEALAASKVGHAA